MMSEQNTPDHPGAIIYGHHQGSGGVNLRVRADHLHGNANNRDIDIRVVRVGRESSKSLSEEGLDHLTWQFSENKTFNVISILKYAVADENCAAAFCC